MSWGEPLDTLYANAVEEIRCQSCVGIVMTPTEYCHRQDHGFENEKSLFCSCCGEFKTNVSPEAMQAADEIEKLFIEWSEKN